MKKIMFALFTFKSLLVLIVAVIGIVIGFGLRQARVKRIASINQPSHQASVISSTRAETKRSSRSLVFAQDVDAYVQQPMVRQREPNHYIESQPRTVSSSDPRSSLLRLKDYMRGLEGKNALLKEKTDLLNNLLQSKEKELARLNEFNTTLKENLDQALLAQNKLKSDIDALNVTLVQKESEISVLGTIRTSLEAQLKELKNAQGSVQQDLQSKISQAEQDKAALETQLIKIKSELALSSSANENLNKNIADLTQALQKKEEDRKGLINDFQQWKDDKTKLELELERLKADKALFENQVAQLKTNINDLTAEYEKSRASAQELTTLISKKDLEKELAVSDAKHEIIAASSDLQKLNSEKQALVASIGEKEKIIQDLRDRLKDFEVRMQAMQKDLEAERERQQQSAEQLAKVQALNESLQARLKNIYIELEMLRAEKTSKKKTYQLKYKKLINKYSR
ncbi:MAG: hypothetical protein KBA46_01785 [Candidatus Omnitrophica bacterium]|nr:hypothetical protein [Candidatus Omnitrophota bacterium]